MVSRFFPVPFGKWMIVIDVLEHLVIAVHLREEKYQIGNNNSEIDLVLATITWAIRHFDILFWIPVTSLSNKKIVKKTRWRPLSFTRSSPSSSKKTLRIWAIFLSQMHVFLWRSRSSPCMKLYTLFLVDMSKSDCPYRAVCLSKPLLMSQKKSKTVNHVKIYWESVHRSTTLYVRLVNTSKDAGCMLQG